jgi:hypothetical protein
MQRGSSAMSLFTRSAYGGRVRGAEVVEVAEPAVLRAQELGAPRARELLAGIRGARVDDDHLGRPDRLRLEAREALSEDVRALVVADHDRGVRHR